jgi:hypothetical protein
LDTEGTGKLDVSMSLSFLSDLFDECGCEDKEEFMDKNRSVVLREWYAYFSGGGEGLSYAQFMEKVCIC